MARFSKLIAVALSLAIASSLYSHPGRTDSNGGHYNRKTGEYHYHGGGPARSASPPSVPSTSSSRLFDLRPSSPDAKPQTQVKAAPISPRMKWHGVDGAILVYGGLLAVDGPEWRARIQKTDMTEVDVDLESLSLADRAFALSHEDSDSEFQRRFRPWTSANGRHQVSAKALFVENETARLRRFDTNVINVPLAKLSSEDRSFLERLTKAVARSDVDNDNPFASVEAFTGHQPQSQSRIAPLVSESKAGGESKAGEVDGGLTVYVTRSGSKYHLGTCHHLRASKISMPLSEAARRYSACSVCNPPVPSE